MKTENKHKTKKTVEQFCDDEKRKWQRLTCFACIVSFISFLLNITALAMIGSLRSDSGSSISGLLQMHEKQAEAIAKLSVATWKNDTKTSEEFQKIIDSIRANAKKSDENRKRIADEVNELTDEVKELQGEWRLGCSEHGLTNGSVCYVLRRDKSNYTEAVAKCSEEGGALAQIQSRKVLETITGKFSSPFFVDAQYDRTSGSWRTSTNAEANFLPWKLDKIEPGGDCAYAFRSGYKPWHCHALLPYLCQF